jgi:hypothetical protein
VSWGGLNPALTAWRAGINQRFPGRGVTSDGARADDKHGPLSEHQEDRDGTTDAFDQDVNLLGSRVPGGTANERALMRTLQRDFEQDEHRRGQLWIYRQTIASATIGDWREREYFGPNPHIEHCHWQSRQSREHIGQPWAFRHTDALLARMRGDLPVDAAEQQQLADRIAKAIMDAPIMVNGQPWKYGTAIGYLARKAYEVDQTLDHIAGEPVTPAVAARIEARAGRPLAPDEIQRRADRDAVTPSANTTPGPAAGG